MSGDNYKREVGKLKRRVGVGNEPECFCPTCGQGLTRAGAAAIEARHREAGESARRGMIAYIEEVAERQRLASERAGRKTGEETELREAVKVARGRVTRAPQVVEVAGADVREDKTEQAVRARLDEDPLLKIIRERRAARVEERRQRLEKGQLATVTNNKGGDEE